MARSKLFSWEEWKRIDPDDGEFKLPSLKGKAEDQFFFSREAWSSLSDERYDALRQSFLLASKMLKVGNEYIATFLKPFSSVTIKGITSGGLGQGTEDSYGNANIQLKDPTRVEMMASWIELGQVSRYVTFQEHDDLWSGAQRLATVVHGNPELDYDGKQPPVVELLDIRPDHIQEIDRKHLSQGLSRSKCTVLITRDFVDAILGSRQAENSAAELKVVFTAATVLVSQIGRVVFMQDFHNRFYSLSEEPSVNDNINRDLGDAFLGFIFGGWVPSIATIEENGQQTRNLGNALQWNRVLRSGGGRPWFNTFYLISTRWLERVLSEETWDAVQESKARPQSKILLSNIREFVLHPPAPFEEHDCLRGWTSTHSVSERPVPKTKLQVDADGFPYFDPDWKADIDNQPLLDAQDKLSRSIIERDKAIEERDQAIRARDAALEQVIRLNQTEGGKASLQLVEEHNNAVLAAEKTEGGRASLELASKYNNLANDFRKILQERNEALAKLAKLSKEGAHDSGETKSGEKKNSTTAIKRKDTSNKDGECKDDARLPKKKKRKR